MMQGQPAFEFVRNADSIVVDDFSLFVFRGRELNFININFLFDIRGFPIRSSIHLEMKTDWLSFDGETLKRSRNRVNRFYISISSVD